MSFQKRVMISLITSSLVLVAAIVMPIIPCRTAPAIPNPLYKWKLCSLNPDLVPTTNSIREYFGYTASLTDAYFITLLVSFLVVMVVLHLTMKKTKKLQQRRQNNR